ncbi:hypothetical protein Thimo_3096 [Thioflavicoccus mobilis 8321]|uniref:Uncharacterized protein n=1 Tax=Thioflavicoccus mobilis 8321 TaxID=765912 RepID=L0H2A0_9GAMM|nr:hypothetical protein [Thioflavicoccus mobilis]AGA91780.1 hypothetical protein Thimo_3096 [Thioflavicoccus mobilis 8321]
MDRFTRNYSIALGAIAVAALLVWFFSTWNPRIAELNEVLKADAELASYPYPFRVVGFDDGVATISSPRSFELPAMTFLGVIDPSLKDKAQDDPAMIAAQNQLIHHQKRSQALIEAQPDVTSVRWKLDRNWYAKQGIDIASLMR